MNHFYDSYSLWWSCFCVLFEACLQNFSFCVSWKKIVIQVWNDLSVTKLWFFFFFFTFWGVNYLFNFLFSSVSFTLSLRHRHTHYLSHPASPALSLYMWFSVHHHHPICFSSVSNPCLYSTRVVVLVSSRYRTLANHSLILSPSSGQGEKMIKCCHYDVASMIVTARSVSMRLIHDVPHSMCLFSYHCHF